MPYFVAFLNKVDPKKDKELLEIHIDYLNKHIELGNIFIHSCVIGCMCSCFVDIGDEKPCVLMNPRPSNIHVISYTTDVS